MSASDRKSVPPPAPPEFGDAPVPWPGTPPASRGAPSSWPRIASVCIAIVVAAVVTAFVLGSRGPDVYGGRADVLYVAAAEVPLDVRERVLATHAELITSRAVLQPVAARARTPLGELQDAVAVDIGLNDLLEITVRDEERSTARDLAELVAQRYVAFAETIPSQANVRRLSPAYVLDEPVAPKPLRAVAVGLLVGLQLAIVAALLLLRRARRRP